MNENLEPNESKCNLEQYIINEICKVAEKYPVNKITLFGSRARGDNKNKSDIDLAIYCDKSFEDKGDFYFDIEDIETLLKFDIVFINEGTEEKLIKNIEGDGVVVYEGK